MYLSQAQPLIRSNPSVPSSALGNASGSPSSPRALFPDPVPTFFNWKAASSCKKSRILLVPSPSLCPIGLIAECRRFKVVYSVSVVIIHRERGLTGGRLAAGGTRCDVDA